MISNQDTIAMSIIYSTLLESFIHTKQKEDVDIEWTGLFTYIWVF